MRFSTDLISRLRGATHVAVFTGAGVSAESGIPTFRDRQSGLWQNFDAQSLATPEAFERDPAFVWGWYEWRRSRVLASQPNAAHRAIALLAERVPRLTLITQNVDDLHERGRRLEPPRCGQCGGRVRPGVVWFGESLPRLAWEQAVQAARGCGAFLCVGTSSIVEPAASLTRVAIAAGSVTIQVNIDRTWLDDLVTLNLRGPAASMLPDLVAQVWPQACCGHRRA